MRSSRLWLGACYVCCLGVALFGSCGQDEFVLVLFCDVHDFDYFSHRNCLVDVERDVGVGLLTEFGYERGFELIVGYAFCLDVVSQVGGYGD